MLPALKVEIAGVPISVITPKSAVAQIAAWINARESHYICVADVHSIMRAQSDPSHNSIMKNASMVTPDGQPLVWTARAWGNSLIERVCGSDLMLAVCQESQKSGWQHYFYGGSEEQLTALRRNLSTQFPAICIAGSHSPPYRSLLSSEDQEIIEIIKKSGAKIVWVGLGCPKQEAWMASHLGKIPETVLIGVGAAFAFHSGLVARAPRWMRHVGLEWLHRLSCEPRRLWRRYLILAPKFIILVLRETLRRSNWIRT